MLEEIVDDQGRDAEYYFDTTGRLHEAVGNISYSAASKVAYLKTEYVFDAGVQLPEPGGADAGAQQLEHDRDAGDVEQPNAGPERLHLLRHGCAFPEL